MTQVVLAFPPLVETNFGGIFPSTAVLASYLEPHGFPVHQVDLNTPFLQHMVTAEELAANAAGTFVRSRPITRAAARWIQSSMAAGDVELEDLLGAHEEAGRPIDTIVRHLVAPYSVDPDRSVVDGSFADEALVVSYRRYAEAHVQDLVGVANGPLLVGLSVAMGPQLLPALQLASVIREARPTDRCRIVLGGPTLSLLDERDLALLLRTHPAVDAIVRFDGEHPLHDLVAQVDAGEWEPWRVPGTSSIRAPRDGTDEAAVTHAAPARGPDLNQLATPRYPADLVASAPRAALAVTQARGCYWGKCDYCDFVEVYQGSPAYRGRRAELVVEDIRALAAETGVHRFRIITESIPAAFARRFASLLLEGDLRIRWSSFVMVDRRFDIELLRSMAASGCEFLVVGLESMTTSALARVHKSADREQNIRFLTDAHEAGIRLSVNLIPDLPSTTYEQARAGLDDLEGLASCFEHVKIFEFEVTRSSRVGRAPADFGLRTIARSGRRSHAQLAVNAIAVDDPAMTARERTEVLAEYRAFATRVNNRHQVTTGQLDRSYVQAIPTPDGPLVIDFATLRQVQYPAPAAGAAVLSLGVPSSIPATDAVIHGSDDRSGPVRHGGETNAPAVAASAGRSHRPTPSMVAHRDPGRFRARLP